MSMISAQIDELRNTAEFYDGFKAANLMRDAADTIWELRDDLQRTNAENAKLRELCRRSLVVLENNCSQCVYFYECDIVNNCNCVAPVHIRNELHELGIEVDG